MFQLIGSFCCGSFKESFNLKVSLLPSFNLWTAFLYLCAYIFISKISPFPFLVSSFFSVSASFILSLLVLFVLCDPLWNKWLLIWAGDFVNIDSYTFPAKKAQWIKEKTGKTLKLDANILHHPLQPPMVDDIFNSPVSLLMTTTLRLSSFMSCCSPLTIVLLQLIQLPIHLNKQAKK